MGKLEQRDSLDEESGGYKFVVEIKSVRDDCFLCDWKMSGGTDKSPHLGTGVSQQHERAGIERNSLNFTRQVSVSQQV
ncbi:hypothetical protein scyTo_0017767 [Scyliorhinus torazame]|uniref:Uncharacterized protein n=1 Tax=Scyliorhinus torazame TaxID=75743 RepID=A0A401Q042_SCYTO|nr:hypothetical protein [Scyliorhinus torazame]